MGRWLREARVSQNLTQTDVAAAIGRSAQYVCEVEYGKRGGRMDPVMGLLWCEYLSLDPAELFAYLSLGTTEIERFTVQHYLQSGAWAHKFVQARRSLAQIRPLIDELLGSLKVNSGEKDQAFQIRNAVDKALSALNIPRMRK